jgi:type IV pilus assembly protein PilV
MNKHLQLVRQKGMSLLEVLIASLILGIALVSIAMMQMNALKTSSNSAYRSVAADIAGTVAGRMRVNIPGVGGDDSDPSKAAYQQYPWDRSASDNNYLISWSSGSCVTPPQACAVTVAGSGDNCTGQGMAMWDLYEATCSAAIGLDTLLPNAELAIDCTYSIARSGHVPLLADNCQITIKWSDSGNIDLEGDVIGDGKETLILNVTPGTQRTKDPSIVI